MMISRIKDELFERAGTAAESFDISKVNAEWLSSLKGWRDDVEEVVAKHPGASLGIAMAVGIIVGWWTKRK